MSYTLLLADDSETTHRVVALIFADRSVRVVGVLDGQQAIERMSAEPPDIVLAGINLPKVDGYQLADFMRTQHALRNVPIVLTIGAFDAVDEQRVRQSGASGVLNKPFESELVINRVKELLGFGGKTERPAAPPGRLLPHDPVPPRPSLTGPRGAGAPPARPEPPAPPPDAAPESDRSDTTRSSPAEAISEASDPGVPQQSGAVASAHEPAEHRHQPSTWDQLREESGLGPETQHVEAGSAGGADDYFDRLDAAFDNLDAQLSGRTASRPRDTAPTARRMPASYEPSNRRMPPPDIQSNRPPEAVTDESSQPVFEVDSGWFGESASSGAARPAPPAVAGPELPASDSAPPPAADRPEPPPVAWPETPSSYGATPPVAPPQPPASDTATPPDVAHLESPPVGRPETPPSYGEVSPYGAPSPAVDRPEPPAVARPESPASYSAPPPASAAPAAPVLRVAAIAPGPSAAASFADAFDQMLAAEQGEAPQPMAEAHGQAPVIEISEEVIEQIALRVAERLSDGLLAETVAYVVTPVAERLVREEIARIRAAAQKKSP